MNTLDFFLLSIALFLTVGVVGFVVGLVLELPVMQRLADVLGIGDPRE